MIEQLQVNRRTLLQGLVVGTGVAIALPYLAPPPARAAGAPTPAGISANSGILWEDDASLGASLDFMSAIGATSIRIDIPWNWIERTRGTFTWSLVDRVVDAAGARGMKILGVLTTSPQWAALGGSSNPQTRPANTNRWTTFVGNAARRYRGKIYAYEVWNEPNAREYFAPNPDPAAYAALVRAAVPAIAQADPNAQIIAGALGPAPSGDGTIRALDFFTAMLDAGVGAVSAYSFHPYDNDHTMAQAAFWDNTAVRDVIQMHRILKARGQGDKKIWATEYGAPASLGEQRQADLVVAGIQQWRECNFTGPMFIHHHRDQNDGDSYGLCDSDLNPRPAAYGVQSLHHYNSYRQGEAVVFESNADGALGVAVSPVYPLADGYAQEFEEGTRYASPVGWLSAPVPIADLLRRANRQPASGFTTTASSPLAGWQDMLIPEATTTPAARVFTSSFGTFIVAGSLLAAWDATLGSPTSDQRAQGNGVVQDFEKGSLSWAPGVPVTVTRR